MVFGYHYLAQTDTISWTNSKILVLVYVKFLPLHSWPTLQASGQYTFSGGKHVNTTQYGWKATFLIWLTLFRSDGYKCMDWHFIQAHLFIYSNNFFIELNRLYLSLLKIIGNGHFAKTNGESSYPSSIKLKDSGYKR